MSYGLGYAKVAVQLLLLLKLQLIDKGLHHDCNWQAVPFYCTPLHPYPPTPLLAAAVCMPSHEHPWLPSVDHAWLAARQTKTSQLAS